jgi:hypothetical protein
MRTNLLLTILAAALSAGQVAAQPAARITAQEVKPAADQDKIWADEAARLALVEAKSYDIRLARVDGPRLKLADKTALRWSNSEDATIHGSVLVWMHAGRPEAIASIFKFFTSKDEFSAELHSLSEGSLVATKADHVVWKPAGAGVSFEPLATVAAPAKTAGGRLVQMRGIARDFSGTMTTFDQTTHPLRLLTQPLLRYAGEKERPLDGAIFTFARATDPDVLLLLEARAKAGEEPKWHYALARMHCGALAMSYQGREVWAREQMEHPFARPTGEYTLLQGLPEPKISTKTTALAPSP